MLSMLGLFGGLALLMWLTMRGANLLLAAPACALVVALTSDIALLPQLAAAAGAPSWTGNYMQGFSGFVSSWFLMFLLGSIFGKVMEDSGAADSVSAWVVQRLGVRRAVLAVVIACAILTYGGVSLFVVAFSVYPLALSLFKQADLPRRFIPAALSFGSVTFTMTSAGSPEIQNWIPIEHLHTTPYAGWQVSLVVAIFMAVFGYWWLGRQIRRALARGERFVARDSDPTPEATRALPHPISGFVPLLVVLALAFAFHDRLAQSALIIALLGGTLTVVAANRRYFRNLSQALSEGSLGALIAIANTAAVVGFGAVAKASPAFQDAVAAMTSIPGNELIGAAVAISVIAGLTGSASGGQSIALPLLAPHYLQTGVNPEELHRVVSIASGALDSLPHNGYVVTTIRAICGETHKDAYGPVAAMTVVVPALGLALAIGLFLLF